MNLELTEVLPKFLQDSLLCYTFVYSRVINSAPNITTFNKNGYIYEVKDKKIVNSLEIIDERGSSISCYHIFDSEKFVLCYLIFTMSNKLLFVKRSDNGLQKIKQYKDVKDFEVYDFKNMGYPQVKICFITDSYTEVIEFPIQVERFQEVNVKCFHSEEKSKSISSVTKALAEKLQMVNMHVDQLREEKNQIKKIISLNNITKDDTPTSLLVGIIKFSSVVNKNYEFNIAVVATWYKILGNYLILGLKISNVSKRIVPDIEFIISHKKIQTYTYNFFGYSSGSVRPFYVQPTLKPDEDMTVVGAFQIPSFVIDSKLSFSYCLLSSDIDELLVRDAFAVDVLDIATRRTFQFDEEFTVEDLMAIMATKTETKVKVNTELEDSTVIETVFVKSLDFKRIKYIGEIFLYCTSTFLREVFIIIEQISTMRTVWKLHLYTSDDAQIYFLISALYDLLPEKTTILYDT